MHELNKEGGDGGSSAYFAYFPPFSYERHLGLIARCAGKRRNIGDGNGNKREIRVVCVVLL